MPNKLIKHGTQAGYDVERKTGNICDRCRTAHRVYNRQFTKQYKASGGRKLDAHEVIDHLDKTGIRRDNVGIKGQVQGAHSTSARETHASVDPSPSIGEGPIGAEGEPQSQDGPSLADRLREGLFTLRAEKRDNEYVPVDEYPDYISEGTPDPEPGSGEWAEVKDDEFLVTADGMRAIKDNLGTYLITAGMTLNLIDPYCGAAIKDNLDDMVDSWSRVIANYPSAAKMFMAKGGGKIMAWIDALMATWPILLAIYEHHFARSVQLDSNGRPFRVTSEPSPNGQFATTPQYNYTVD